MSDLEHWTSEDATEREAELLAAVRGERQSPATRRKLAAAIGIGSVAAGASGSAEAGGATVAAKGAAVLGSAGWVKVAVGVGLSGALAAASVGTVRTTRVSATSIRESASAPLSSLPATDHRSSAEMATRPLSEPVASAVTAREVAPFAWTAPPSRQPAVGIPARSRSAAPLAISPSISPASQAIEAPPSGAGIAQPTSLQAELAVLERARGSIDARRWDDAIAALDEYDATYAAGTLAAEARVLRIEALFGAGRKEAARGAAHAFLRAYPNAMQSQRVSSLLAEIDRAP